MLHPLYPFRLALLLALLLSTPLWGAITAPESAKPGELVRVTSDVEADWAVMPEEYQGNVYVDSSKKTLVLSSPKPGTVYIFAASADEQGQPKANYWKLIITPDAPDNPTPEPTPTPTPKPAPNTYPANVVTAIASIQTATKDRELQAFVTVLKSTAGFIADGSITTPTGARETIRRNWQLQTAPINTDAPNAWKQATDALIDALQVESIDAAKANIDTLIKELEPIGVKPTEPTNEHGGAQ